MAEWTWLTFISTQALQVGLQMFADSTQAVSIGAICNITGFGNCLEIHACLQWYPHCQAAVLSSALKCLSESLPAAGITATWTGSNFVGKKNQCKAEFLLKSCFNFTRYSWPTVFSCHLCPWSLLQKIYFAAHQIYCLVWVTQTLRIQQYLILRY